VRDDLPHRERHVLDAVAHFRAAGGAQRRDARVCGVEPEHALEVGDGHQQRSVGISFAQDRVDLENGMGGVVRIDARAVVHDPFEHRQGAQSHSTMLAHAGR